VNTALLVIDVQVGIIDHFPVHNRALNGFSSGNHMVNVKPASEIDFST